MEPEETLCPDTYYTLSPADILVHSLTPVLEGVFNITLVARELMMDDFTGNYASTQLDVVVDEYV